MATMAAVTNAYLKGFNIAAEKPDGSCRTQADWELAFRNIQKLPGGPFDQARLFATSDCNTLARAVPAALAANTRILVGVWTEDEAHFGREKAALLDAIQKYGGGWITAISVGSETLYRKEADPNRLAQQIYDVRGMVRSVGVGQAVGHVDTWTAWVDPANRPVVVACDFVGTDAYPYWQGTTIPASTDTFWKAIADTRAAVTAVKKGLEVWVTETGWPATGKNFGASTASVQNAKAYWKGVACSSLKQMNTFWYSYQDYTSEPSFGVYGKNGQPLFDMTC
ncbi:putative glycoside hydrolase family 17 protein [Neofusicoccum parvum UCRNP2]|uniref:Probable glucan endo-1,3-beta-glucosidase eglC n=2 Tax=Neofusicoccum TaxID=407951 RepID=R1EPH1_BOTPV|nr:putative glycoside hydrolase family 17 protein [Neofusicoccum parvum UCRNP2]